MPRNDQITRQWHLLRQLEGSPGRSLQELVDDVPDDYPKNARTVRRDLEALEAVGFPLVVEKHNGQTRWRLMEGFRDIPALGFSATELMALLLSRNLLKPLEGTEIAESLNSALSKASAALPSQGHEYVRAMEQMFSVGIGPHKNFRQHRQTIDLISQAIDKRRTAQMRYFSASRDSTGRREVDPYFQVCRRRLVPDWPLPLAQGSTDVRRRTHSFDRTHRPSVPNAPGLQGRRIRPGRAWYHAQRQAHRSRAAVLQKAAAWVKDKSWHPSQETQLLKDGRLKMILKVADNDELIGWILSFGSQVRVNKPDVLRQRVREEAKKIISS
jgi:predicted DNA-binding transcriptional regulator YafY